MFFRFFSSNRTEDASLCTAWGILLYDSSSCAQRESLISCRGRICFIRRFFLLRLAKSGAQKRLGRLSFYGATSAPPSCSRYTSLLLGSPRYRIQSLLLYATSKFGLDPVKQVLYAKIDACMALLAGIQIGPKAKPIDRSLSTGCGMAILTPCFAPKSRLAFRTARAASAPLGSVGVSADCRH
jgi:hypothetical protein